MSPIENKARRYSRKKLIPLTDTPSPSSEEELARQQLPVIYGKRVRGETLTQREKVIYAQYGAEYEATRIRNDVDLTDMRD